MKTALKICGIRSAEMASFCDNAGVDFLGLNFVPTSRRAIDVATAQKIKEVVKHAKLVGLFQNERSEVIKKLHNQIGFDLLQLHGEEALPQLEELSRLQIPIIKVIRIFDQNSLAQIDMYKKVVQYLLFDNDGGKGKTFDWSLLDPTRIELPFFIAGGINSQNAASAISKFKPFGLDIASGAEENGELNRGKISEIIDIINAK